MTVLALSDAVGAAGEIVGDSAAIGRVRELVRQCARETTPVLLIGATGTGKELVARALHRASGRRGDLVDVNCGALPSAMVESLLFGHAKGAFTGATETAAGLVQAAHRGTLFLDELGSLPTAGQATLLRVLETGEVRRVGETRKRQVDFRVIAAVQDDLWERVGGGSLRADLIHRIAGTVIHLAPLRERPDDLLPLARHFAAMRGATLATDVEVVLRRHDWPGNVRELRAVVDRALLAGTGGRPVAGRDVAAAIAQGASLSGRSDPLYGERSRLLALCAQHGWRADRIAAALGVHRVTLFRRLRAAGVSLRMRTGAESSGE